MPDRPRRIACSHLAFLLCFLLACWSRFVLSCRRHQGSNVRRFSSWAGWCCPSLSFHHCCLCYAPPQCLEVGWSRQARCLGSWHKARLLSDPWIFLRVYRLLCCNWMECLPSCHQPTTPTCLSTTPAWCVSVCQKDGCPRLVEMHLGLQQIASLGPHPSWVAASCLFWTYLGSWWPLQYRWMGHGWPRFLHLTHHCAHLNQPSASRRNLFDSCHRHQAGKHLQNRQIVAPSTLWPSHLSTLDHHSYSSQCWSSQRSLHLRILGQLHFWICNRSSHHLCALTHC